jgi:NAD(P)-dependent dehydrogenase (short-subunit alcohol dehydrogenase family)
MGDAKKTAFILGVTAEIGWAIAERLMATGWRIVGTGRADSGLAKASTADAYHFIPCDLDEPSSIAASLACFAGMSCPWNLFVSAVGTMEPIGRFFDLPFDEWERSFRVNSIEQLRVLHGIWPQRSKSGAIDIMLMAGGGTNNAFTNYSAYCLSKIALIKMCELIDDEEPSANAFIIGPGYVRTKIHKQTLKAGPAAGSGYEKTVNFLATSGTSFDDIYANMVWCMTQGRAVAGGRNFSTVHDPWKEGGEVLMRRLLKDSDAYRLRRHQPKEEV